MITSGDATVLGMRRQVALATWATKTSMLFEYVSTDRPPYYSDEQHRDLRRTLTPPPGVCRVWAGRYTGPSLACDHLAFFFQSPKTQVYLSTMFIGEYVTQVLAHRPGKIAVRNTHPASRRAAWRDSLLQIWPPTDVGIMWPPRLGLGPDIVQLIRYRFAPLGTFVHDRPPRRDGTLKP